MRSLHLLLFFLASLSLFPIAPTNATAEDLILGSGETRSLPSGTYVFDQVTVPSTALLTTTGTVSLSCYRFDLSGTLQLGGNADITVNYGLSNPTSTDYAMLLAINSVIRCDFHTEGAAANGVDGVNAIVDGGAGTSGTNGDSGKDGYDLTLNIHGNLRIGGQQYLSLYGQSAGDGGRGGEGRGGSNGELSCHSGGTGGAGGDGGNGGDGGDGGNLTLICDGMITYNLYPCSTCGANLFWNMSGGAGGYGGFAGLGGNGGAGAATWENGSGCLQCEVGGPAGAPGIAGHGGRGGDGGNITIHAARMWNVFAEDLTPLRCNGGMGKGGGGGGDGGHYGPGGFRYVQETNCADGEPTQGSPNAASGNGGDGGDIVIRIKEDLDTKAYPTTLAPRVLYVQTSGGLGGVGNLPGTPGQRREGMAQDNALDGVSNAGRGGNAGSLTLQAQSAKTVYLLARGGGGGRGSNGASLDYSGPEPDPLPGNGANGGAGGNGGIIRLMANERTVDGTDVSGGTGGDGGTGGENYDDRYDTYGVDGSQGPTGAGGVLVITGRGILPAIVNILQEHPAP